MRCAHCQREFSPGRRWLRSKAWCSAACRRRMTAETRELMLWVTRWGAAVERPDVVAARDDLVRRFVEASLRRAPPAPPKSRRTFARVDMGELPISSS